MRVLKNLVLTLALPLFYTQVHAQMHNQAQAATPSHEVIDDSYRVCQTQAQYQQLLRWSLYGVGSPPQSGCFQAPAGAKAIILQCPENDMMVCQFELAPIDGSPTLKVWASKVMLKPLPTEQSGRK